METHWNLGDLYTSFDCESFAHDLKMAKQSISEINSWASSNLLVLNSTPAETIKTYITKMNSFSKFYKLYYYASLVASADTENDTANKFVDNFRNEMTNLTKTRVMFTKFVQGCDIDSVVLSCETCREHEFFLHEVKQDGKYMLAEDVEEALSKMKITASGAWNIMKENLTATLSIDVEINGVVSNLPLSAVRNLAHDPNPRTRQNAYNAELKAYEQIEKPVAAALNSIKGEVLTECKLRGYNSPLDMTLHNSRMSRDTLNAMISAIEQKSPNLRRFFAKKALLLGHKKHLPYYDLFAPISIGEANNMRFTYDEAADFVIQNFTVYSEKLGNFAKKAFNDCWIDALPRKGKRGGAFCMNIHPINQSRILTNFTGSLTDVSTIAHELGHAYHGLCLGDETYINSDYPMPIAETASTFCETLIFDSALKSVSKNERLAVLEGQLTDMTQVIIDIYARYVFETELFIQREKGPLSVNEIKSLMNAAQSKAYGDTFGTDAPHPYMWVNKPHYYFPSRNFYNFPYAYGLLFALGLYSEYKKIGTAFIPKYDELLAVTGKMSLVDIGKKAGINVEDTAFWLSSLKQIEAKVDEFCAY